MVDEIVGAGLALALVVVVVALSGFGPVVAFTAIAAFGALLFM
jgi:hypothetical protein